MTKEISDKIIYVLLALAILICFLGTFFVYHKASEINSNVVAQNIDNLFIKEQPSEGYVGVYVAVPNETEKKDT